MVSDYTRAEVIYYVCSGSNTYFLVHDHDVSRVLYDDTGLIRFAFGSSFLYHVDIIGLFEKICKDTKFHVSLILTKESIVYFLSRTVMRIL